jgi:hypothetical protein
MGSTAPHHPNTSQYMPVTVWDQAYQPKKYFPNFNDQNVYFRLVIPLRAFIAVFLKWLKPHKFIRRLELVTAARPLSSFMWPVDKHPRPIKVAVGGADTGQNPTPPPHTLLICLFAATHLRNFGDKFPQAPGTIRGMMWRRSYSDVVGGRNGEDSSRADSSSCGGSPSDEEYKRLVRPATANKGVARKWTNQGLQLSSPLLPYADDWEAGCSSRHRAHSPSLDYE